MSLENLEYLKVYNHPKKIRLGIKMDGGYIIADLSGGYDCYVSAGVGREESFTSEFIKKYGMNEFNSFAIDGSIEEYPIEYTNNISFIKKNISPTNNESCTNLEGVFKQYNNIFLKMDIEGGEFPWLDSLDKATLQKIKQFVIECHGINNDSWGNPYSLKKACLEKLTETHVLIHAHGNNSRGLTYYIPNVIELTYIRRDCMVSEVLNTHNLPISGLDFPNNSKKPDYILNFAPFKTFT